MQQNRITFLILVLIFGISCSSKSTKDRISITELEKHLEDISAIQDDSQRKAEADSLWKKLTLEDQIPFKQDSIVVFLFKGEADQVSWNGDFNSWSGDKSFDNEGSRIEGTNIWMLKAVFPVDARIDYKVTIDESWILDPVNPHYNLYSGWTRIF